MERYIKSHIIYIYIGILLAVVSVFLNSSLLMTLYSYVALGLGVLGFLHAVKSTIYLTKNSSYIYSLTYISLVLYLLIYLKIVKDPIYVSWDYLAVYYPNSLRLVEEFLIIPTLYLPVLLYGAPLIVVEVLSHSILSNIFAGPIFFTTNVILLSGYLLRQNDRIMFVFFNPVTIIYLTSFFGYLEVVAIFYILSLLVLLTKHDINFLYFGMVLWYVFMLKPYMVFAVVLILIFIIVNNLNLSKITTALILLTIIAISYLGVLYQGAVQGTVSFSPFWAIYTGIIIVILFLTFMKTYTLPRLSTRINLTRQIIKLTIISFLFVLIILYVFINVKLLGLSTLATPEFQKAIASLLPSDGYSKARVRYYEEYNYKVILLLTLLTIIHVLMNLYVVKHKHVDHVQRLELLMTIGLSFGLLVIMDFWPREFIRRVFPFMFFLIFSITRLFQYAFLLRFINLQNILLLSITTVEYFTRDISKSWFEIKILSNIDIYATILLYSLIFTLMLFNTRLITPLSKYLYLATLLALAIKLILLLNLIYHDQSISISREFSYYLQLNLKYLHMVSLDSSSVLTCGLFHNKFFGLKSYDVITFSPYILIYNLVYNDISLHDYNITAIYIVDTPLARFCNTFLHNLTSPFFKNIEIAYLR